MVNSPDMYPKTPRKMAVLSDSDDDLKSNLPKSKAKRPAVPTKEKSKVSSDLAVDKPFKKKSKVSADSGVGRVKEIKNAVDKPTPSLQMDLTSTLGKLLKVAKDSKTRNDKYSLVSNSTIVLPSFTDTDHAHGTLDVSFRSLISQN